MFIDYFLEHNRYLNFFGIIFILGIAFIFSKKKSKINFKLVINALILQFVLAFFILKTTLGQYVFSKISQFVYNIYQFADSGSQFVFGNLTNATGPWGFVFAIKVLPIIIFFGALMSLLFHWRIVQVIVSGINFIIRPLLGTSGAETLCAISNSFLGQTEAPLLVKNYLRKMTKSEMFVVMVSGMSTISGSILAVFVAMGVPAQHLLAASVMAIPGSILIAKIIYPETEKAETAGGVKIDLKVETKNTLDAISIGTTDGLKLALNVGAMLIAFIALITMVNAILSWFSPSFNLGFIFSYLFFPFGFFLGLKGDEALKAGQLLGTKVTINELVAYGEMLQMGLSERAINIITYALCGFSNFSCIGIQIGGIGALVPEKRKWLTELGLFAVLGSSLSNLLSAMIASLLL